MVSTIQRDIERLRTATGGGGRRPDGECPECGWGGGGDDFGPNDTFEISWVNSGGPEDKEEWCETCGRQLVIVLTWGADAS